jgi:acetolactate synthase-1/2/3 large subunit
VQYDAQLGDAQGGAQSGDRAWDRAKCGGAARDPAQIGDAARGGMERCRALDSFGDMAGDADILLNMLGESERPMIISGGGVIRANASGELRALARAIRAPVACTMMGLGSIRSDDPLFLGLIGMHGSEAANAALDLCDLLIAVGMRFSDRVAPRPERFARNAKIVHIDIDRAEIDKNVLTAHHITGDARIVLRRLLRDLPGEAGQGGPPLATWLDALGARAARGGAGESRPGDSGPQPSGDSLQPGCIDAPQAGGDSGPQPRGGMAQPGGGLSPRGIVACIQARAGDDAVIVTDVGQHQIWAAQHCKFTGPRTFITSGGYGAMGFGLGAAIGAHIGMAGLARPASREGARAPRVVLITGDGSFRMNLTELSTVRCYGLPIIVVIINNRALGLVRQWQKLLFGGRYSNTDLDREPDFIKLAEAYGIQGHRPASLAELDAALGGAVASGRAAIIECALPKDEPVMPMAMPAAAATAASVAMPAAMPTTMPMAMPAAAPADVPTTKQ